MVLRASLAVAFLFGLAGSSQAPSNPSQSPPAPQATQSTDEQNTSANQLVKAVVQNELRAVDNDHTHWMYQLETRKDGVSETKELVETPHGNLTRVIARSGQPLSPDDQKKEDANLQKL